MAGMEITDLCIDTSPLIAYLKGREPGASSVERAVSSYTCHVTSITVYELLYGVARARRHIGENALLSIMKVAAFDSDAATIAAQLHSDLIGANQDIGVKDVLIASTCLSRRLPLFTLNTKHFSRVPGLSLVSHEDILGV
jgi:tRNA(fMet)-specific endonuclease VapC